MSREGRRASRTQNSHSSTAPSTSTSSNSASSHPSTSVHSTTTATDLTKLTAQEYLDKFTVTAYLKDVTTLLLDNRPSCPASFIADYFKNVAGGTSPLVRSYRYIKLTALNRQSFWDNLVAAYATIDDRKEGAGVGITGADMRRLIHLLCVDFPTEIVSAVLEILEKTETCIVPFRQFAAGIYSCLMYEQFFAASERLFLELDTEGKGYVCVNSLKDALYAALHAQKREVDRGGGGPTQQHLVHVYSKEFPSKDEVAHFLASIEGVHVTFKQFMRKVFTLTDPVSSQDVNSVAAKASAASRGTPAPPKKAPQVMNARMPAASPLGSHSTPPFREEKAEGEGGEKGDVCEKGEVAAEGG